VQFGDVFELQGGHLAGAVVQDMKVQVLTRDYPDRYGLHHYSKAICRTLAEAGTRFEVVRPELPRLLRGIHGNTIKLGFDVERFFNTFPISAKIDQESLKHLTTQQMGSLLVFQPRIGPVVVSVHDMIPYLVRGHREQDTFRHVVESAFDSLAMAGLKRAECLVASSAYTKLMLIDHLKIPADKIRVVPLGIDHRMFKPEPIDRGFRGRYGLEEERRHLLFVGAEIPRKNLARLLLAVAKVKLSIPKIRLIMVGGCEHGQHRRQLQEMVERLGLGGVVQFAGYVPEHDLVQFYNLADIFVFPSLYEGFGLPPLEAMACGLAVICARAGALPEVVGEAAILIDPQDVDALAQRIERVLEDRRLKEELRCRGLEQARKFSWEKTAAETARVYKQVGGWD
jgi:glycosyltransferase involved in cell wall biosynthesis